MNLYSLDRIAIRIAANEDEENEVISLLQSDDTDKRAEGWEKAWKSLHLNYDEVVKLLEAKLSDEEFVKVMGSSSEQKELETNLEALEKGQGLLEKSDDDKKKAEGRALINKAKKFFEKKKDIYPMSIIGDYLEEPITDWNDILEDIDDVIAKLENIKV